MKVKKLFLDLDGVLADFDRGVEAITGKRPDELATSTMWRALARHGDFFGALEMMADAQHLWDFCEPYDPTILTGLPRGDWAEPQKRRWVANMLGRDVDVITCWSRDKPRWSGPGHVLVDDRKSLREPWEAKGGVFILHVDAERTIEKLQALGL
jgi:hypothetical protein